MPLLILLFVTHTLTKIVEYEDEASPHAVSRPVAIISSDSSDHDQIIPTVDDRHGVVKTPSEEESRFISQQKQEAFLTLASQLDQMTTDDDDIQESTVHELGTEV